MKCNRKRERMGDNGRCGLSEEREKKGNRSSFFRGHVYLCACRLLLVASISGSRVERPISDARLYLTADNPVELLEGESLRPVRSLKVLL